MIYNISGGGGENKKKFFFLFVLEISFTLVVFKFLLLTLRQT